MSAAALVRISIALILFASFGCTEVTKGIVVGKSYTPESSYVTIVCVMTTTTGTCVEYTPVIQEVPADWELQLRDDTQDKPIDKQDTGWITVDKSTFLKYRDGDHYP